MELYGADGSLFIPDPNFFGGSVGVAVGNGERGEPPGWDHPFGRPNATDGSGTERANYRCAGLADMATAIGEGRQHRCNIDVAVHAVDVMTGILRAGETRRWVDMTTTCDRPDALSPTQAATLMA
jgi:predicted dehydrogenase